MNAAISTSANTESSGIFIRRVRFNMSMCPDFLMGLANNAFDEAMDMLDEDGLDPSFAAMELMQLSHTYRERAYEAHNMIENDVEPKVFELTRPIANAA